MNKIIISTIIILLLDYIYILIIQNRFNDQIFSIQNSNPSIRILGAIICYVLLIFAINYFIISNNKSPIDAFLLGLVIYGVYDSTNYATITNWTATFSCIDTIWGGILFGLTTHFTYLIK